MRPSLCLPSDVSPRRAPWPRSTRASPCRACQAYTLLSADEEIKASFKLIGQLLESSQFLLDSLGDADDTAAGGGATAARRASRDFALMGRRPTVNLNAALANGIGAGDASCTACGAGAGGSSSSAQFAEHVDASSAVGSSSPPRVMKRRMTKKASVGRSSLADKVAAETETSSRNSNSSPEAREPRAIGRRGTMLTLSGLSGLEVCQRR